MRGLHKFLGALLFFGLLAVPAAEVLGQVQSTILGTVKDSSGAVVVGATITVKNEGTNAERSMVTDPNGDYRIAGLETGFYQVSASAPGFKSVVHSKIDLNSSQIKRVDVGFEVGEITSTISVEGSLGQVETETATLSNVKTSRDFDELPESPLGRSWANVAKVTAGVQNSYVVNGARDTGVNFTTDGSAVNSPVFSSVGANGFNAGIETFREMKVITANSSAEYSQVSQFVAITRSGENALHGSVYWANYNSYFSAHAWNDPSKPSFENHNMFHANVGGPLDIPHVYDGHNKTFYFFDYSGSRYRYGGRQYITIPTPAFRQGDFSALLPQVQIVDPLTGLPFLNNKIPSDRISSVSQKVQDLLYPDPNLVGSGDFGLTENYTNDPGNQYNADNFYIRVDHNLSNKNTLFTRIGIIRHNQDINPGPLKGGFGDGSGKQNIPSRNVMISDTHTFNPNLVNEAKFAFNRNGLLYSDYNYGQDVLSQIGLQGIDNPSNDPAISGMPGFSFSGIVGFSGNSGWATLRQADNTYQLIDNLSWYRGRHSFKMGFDGRRYQYNDEYKDLSVRGSFAFDDQLSGFSYANFLLGYPSYSARSMPRPNAYIRSWQMGFYIQDDFKINQKITLNYGLRYDVQTPWVEKYNHLYNFDPKTGNLVTAGSSLPADMVPEVAAALPITPASSAGYPTRSLIHGDHNNWSPRVGLAFRPFSDATTVIRAGFGLYTQMLQGNLTMGLTGGPWQSNQSWYIENNVPRISFPNPFTIKANDYAGLYSATGVSPDFPWERSYQWNFSVGRQIWGTAIDLSYVGTRALHIPYTDNLNLLHPSTTPYDSARMPYQLFNPANLIQTGGSSIFHGFNVQADRRLSKGLSFNTNYSWSKGLSDVSLAGFGPSAQQNQYARYLERADDSAIRRHVLRFSFVYNLPFGKGRQFLNNVPKFANFFLGGWEVMGITTMQSGARLSPSFSGTDPANTNEYGGRPDRVGDGMLSGVMRQMIKSGLPILDKTAFVRPESGRGFYGNSARNILTGPGQEIWNLSMAKNWKIKENARLQFRCDTFNAFNRANFGNPNTNINSASFGLVSRYASGMRRLVLGARIDF